MSSKFASGNFPKSDGRTGLGYGQLSPVHHLPYQKAGTFPYSEDEWEDELDDIEIDEETISAVNQKTATPRNYDPIPSGNHFYNISGNRKIYEIRSLSPYYDGSQRGKINRHGDRKGWNYLPDIWDEDSEEPIYSLEDLSDKQENNLREWINLILRTI